MSPFEECVILVIAGSAWYPEVHRLIRAIRYDLPCSVWDAIMMWILGITANLPWLLRVLSR